MTPHTVSRMLGAVAVAGAAAATGCAADAAQPGPAVAAAAEYPWHTDIVATTFWVGEIFDPTAEDGSQVLSTYDAHWLESYGGCDGVSVDGQCRTESRTADNGYFPRNMTPRENPFYLDLPFDDVNDEIAFAQRGEVVPWADESPYRERISDPSFSLMKNRWVRLKSGDNTCYGQIQDAGPANYHDADYVFGADDRRPASDEFNGAGLDVSPALNGCLGFRELDGQNDRVDWQFVDEGDVPPGPWLTLVTTSGVQQ
ncbi:LGFP repeat-containing protein [Prescottella defluvii]|uniref:hypothetical protein n=1 Tax=Prescottella defluvii TaxID=1323361 RepID=UPI000ACE000F|nr:hypothetical protein [Prescottella defluvii]